MYQECPHCGSFDVRRSRTDTADNSLRRIFRSPYRCRRCRKLFWAANGRGYRLAIIAGVVGMTGIFGLGLFAVVGYHGGTPGEALTDRSRIEATLALATQGDPAAEHEMARRFGSGRGVPPSDKERLLWLQRAAGHGNVEAQYELGIALRNGHGAVQDIERAATWLEQAAQHGNGLAQFELGLLYRGGTGLAADNVRAYTWLNLAAAQGVAGAGIARDAVLRQLSPDETRKAQAEAQRMSEAQKGAPLPAR